MSKPPRGICWATASVDEQAAPISTTRAPPAWSMSPTRPVTAREASAEAIVTLSAEAFAAVMDGTAPKGDVLAAARIAGIMAAKKRARTDPALPSACAQPRRRWNSNRCEHMPSASSPRATTTGQTGVEMEALTAAAVAALTLYDMIKAVDKAAVIESVRLLAKSGGKSGDYRGAAKFRRTSQTRIGNGRSAPTPSRRAKPTRHDGRSGCGPRPGARCAARSLPHLHDQPPPAPHRMGEGRRRHRRRDHGLSHRPLARLFPRGRRKKLARAAQACAVETCSNDLAASGVLSAERRRSA